MQDYHPPDKPHMPGTYALNTDYKLDKGPTAYRIGLIVMDTDETSEWDFQRLLPADGEVMFYTSRITTVNPVTLGNLRKHGPQLARAAVLLLPDVDLDTVVYSCTSGTVAMGFAEVQEQVRQGRPQVSVITPITAATAAFRELGIDTISLLTPYIDSVNQSMCKFIEKSGVSVRNISSFCVESDVDIARIPPAAIIEGAHSCYRQGSDALFISCTALRAAAQAGRLEAELGVPVLTSNQCMFWQALRTAGYRKPLSGHGRILERPG